MALLLVVTMLCLFNSAALAATRYVQKTGSSDSNPCTQAAPCQTIGRGIDTMASGDTLEIGGGTYNECIEDFGEHAVPGGQSWSLPTTIKNKPGETVWLKRTTPCAGGLIEMDFREYIVIDGINVDAIQPNGVDPWTFGIGTAAAHIRFQNLEIMHAGANAKLNGRFNEIINVDTHHAGVPFCPSEVGCHGIYWSGTDGLIHNVVSHDNNCIGITMTSETGGVVNNTTQYSTVYNNGCSGIVSHPNNRVIGNVVYNNALGIHVSHNVLVYNNTVYNNNASEVGIWPNGGGSQLKNNISLGHRWDILNQETGDNSYAANICAQVNAPDTIGCTRGSTASALFVNAGAADFHLRSGSPAIDAGVTLALVTQDRDGVPRPQPPGGAYDIGAYERTGTATGGTTLSASPSSVAPGGTITATWSGIATPSATDWLGLYTPGAANTAYLAWIYVSCSQTPGAARAAGSCAFVVPSTVAPGTYQLRLLANNGFTPLATSNTFTVTLGF
jgi:hypothetical protein